MRGRGEQGGGVTVPSTPTSIVASLIRVWTIHPIFYWSLVLHYEKLILVPD